MVRLSSLALNNVNEASLELDSHTDTYVLGGSALEIQDYGRPVIVEGYDSSLGSHTYRTISGVWGGSIPTPGVCTISLSTKGSVFPTWIIIFAA